MSLDINTTPQLLDPPELNLLRPEFLDDPRPVYARMSSAGPVRWSEAIPPGSWLVTGFTEAVELLRDKRFGKADYWDRLGEDRGGKASEPLAVIRGWLSQIDPPDHGRIRGAFGRSFTPRTVEGLRPRITEIAGELLTRFEAAGGGDFMAEVAFPIPALVIAEVLGVPRADVELFKHWSLDLSALFEAFVSETDTARAHTAIIEFKHYLGERIDSCRPTDGTLLATLVNAHRDGDISADELLANTIFMIWAGHETTMSLLGNALLTLLRHPDQWQALVDDPDLVPGAVEESLRYEGPIRITSRIAREDVTYSGQEILAGQMAVVCSAVANHDPATFPDPDRFDIRRGASGSLAFGGGAHYCMGAPLARVEAQQTLLGLVTRMPGLRLRRSEPDWSGGLFLRRLNTLEVEL